MGKKQAISPLSQNNGTFFIVFNESRVSLEGFQIKHVTFK